MSSEVAKKDIPTAAEMRIPFLLALKSGRAKSFKNVEREVATMCELSSEQRSYKIKGSKTALFSNRIADTRSALIGDGLVESAGHGKMQLTDEGKAYVKKLSGQNAIPKQESDDSRNQAKPVKVVSEDKIPAGTPRVKVAKSRAPIAKESAKTAVEDSHAERSSIANTDEAGSEAKTVKSKQLSESVDSANVGNIIKSLSNKAVAVAAVVLFAISFGMGSIAGSSVAKSQADANLLAMQNRWSAEAKAEQDALTASSELSFVVNSSNNADSGATVYVRVTGSSDNGEKVDDEYRATPNQAYSLDYEAGVYLIELDVDKTANGNRVYKHDAMKVVYAGNKSVEADLTLEVDEEKTAAKEEEERKKAEEARIKAEEEAKAKAEAEEQARIEEEQRALAEQQEREAAEAAAAAAAATKAASTYDAQEITVYRTNTGKKYHHYGCRYLKDSCIAISLSEAEAMGLQPCSVCF